MSFTDYASGISLPDCSKLAINWKNDNDVTICMSISLLVMELWEFSFIRDWPEIGISEIPSCEFWQISGHWGELGMPSFTGMSVIKCYWMLQNTRVTAFYHFWVIKGKSTVGIKLIPPTQTRVNWLSLFRLFFLHFNKFNSITNFLWF